MQKIITIKYGELSTKKDNRNFFIKILNNNIKQVINHDDIISYDYGRMFIIPKEDNFEETINKLKNIFGIHEIVIAYKLEDKALDNVKKNLLSLLQQENFTTFKVEVKRSDKSYPYDSMTLRKDLGAYILKNMAIC